MTHIIDWLMAQSPVVEPTAGLEAWWSWHTALRETFGGSIDLAIAGGFRADRLGFAFASGYQAACSALFDDDPLGPRAAAVCATEQGSAHPSDMKTTLIRNGEGWLLRGQKSYVTLGVFAERFLVVATEGVGDDGRNRLRIVSIDNRDGVDIHPLEAAPFVPEIPHARLVLRDVHVTADEVFAGDGYTRFLKPFRTVEDVHVHGALLGWLLQIARRSWPHGIVEEILALALMVRATAQLNAASPAGHLALGGVMTRVRDLLARVEPLWSEVDVTLRERWERDRRLLTVASSARHKRLESAWRGFDQT